MPIFLLGSAAIDAGSRCQLRINQKLLAKCAQNSPSLARLGDLKTVKCFASIWVIGQQKVLIHQVVMGTRQYTLQLFFIQSVVKIDV